ncbi:MAG: glycosyltransferase family 4 protein [Candidatus Omnitrophica bacterium]|nr:glycosyltransferase family 4 protein [Candidatus Omnitrophota bacterium]
MQKVNILYLVTKLELGGAQIQLLNIIRRLDKERYRPFLFTAKEGFLIREASSIDRLTLAKSGYLDRPINLWKDILALAEIRRFIKKNNISIVHTHSSKAGILGRLAARLAGINYIIHTVHGWSFNDYQLSLIRSLYIILERIAARFTKKIIVVSYADMRKGLNAGIGRKDQYIKIDYGTDYTKSSKSGADIKQGLGIGAQDLVVTNISCFKPQKAPLDFIRLASLLSRDFPQLKFVMVGDGALRPDIEDRIKRLHLEDRIILTGWRRDIPDILEITDILALTSLWEGVPIAVLEAMAASRAVVATSTGGIEEIIDNGHTGFLISAGDMPQMKEKVSLLLSQDEARRSMGRKARDFIRGNFTVENMAWRNHRIYEDFIGSRPRHN